MFKKIKYISLIILFSTCAAFSNNEIYISATVNDKIITNHDIIKESDYLQILNPNLLNIDNKQKFEMAKNSLINEIIKREEVEKFFNFDKPIPLINDYLSSLYMKLNLDNETDFKKLLNKNSNYTLDEIKEKIKIEILWNNLIFSKYENQVKINKDLILNKIETNSKKTRKEFFLSEIIFEKNTSESLEILIKKIKSSINEIGFNNTANIFSISESSKLGGKLGWIDENNLSEQIFNELQKLNEGEYTDVIKVRNIFMILKIEEVRFKEVLIDKKKELEEMINFEKNKQLNQFSRIYFDKLKINYSINEK